MLEQRLDPASLSAGGWDLPWDLPYLVDCWTVTGLLWDTLSSDEVGAACRWLLSR